MTIKEIEEASGMQRANIRYYEEEGFLNPEREKNGYRNYTEADLNILKKIKLLRSLHVSLEDIKAMHRGTQDLAGTLEEHITYLTLKQQDLEKSKYVCEKMQRDGATYEKLNTEQYLLVLKKCLPDVTEKEEWVERDTPEPVFLWWFGTTPGKALLGLWVSSDVGGPIAMDMAWARSWRAILGHHDLSMVVVQRKWIL